MIEISVKGPARSYYEGMSNSITLPGSNGQFQILTGHAPILAQLKQGDIIIETDNGKKSIKINEGMLDFKGDCATVLVL